MGKRKVFDDFMIFVCPLEWVLWPIFRRDKWNENKRINLGPLVIKWRHYTVTDG